MILDRFRKARRPYAEPDLNDAARRGDLAVVRAFRERGGDLHVDNEAMLLAAVAAGQIDVARFIHEDGGRLDACDTLTILSAIEGGHWSVLSYMFQSGYSVSVGTMKAAAARLTATNAPPSHDEAVVRARRNLVEAVTGAARAPLPDAGARWGTYAAWTRAVAPYLGTAREVVDFAQNTVGHGGFESRLTGDALRDYATDMDRRLAERFPDQASLFASFTESALSDRVTTAFVGGRPVSAPTYANMTFLLECVTRIERPLAVCELGGGYGGPARLWLTNAVHRPDRYVIVDLPESLFFSEVFLRTEFGPDQVCYLQTDVPAEQSVFDNHKVVLCPSHCLGALANIEFDLIYNTLSLQEMSDSYVDFYMDWFDRQACRHIYSFNYAGQPFAAHPESANKGAPRLGAEWHPLWTAPWPFGPSPACHLLAQKQPGLSPAERSAAGRQLLQDRIGEKADPAALLALLSAARLCDDPEVIFTVIDKIATDMPEGPRELVQLLELIDPVERARFSEVQTTRLAAIARALEGQAAQGSIAPHLQELWRQYAATPG